MFGYDFMVDTSLNVWLIEVNSSPAMDYSSPITEKMVKEVLPNISEILDVAGLTHDCCRMHILGTTNSYFNYKTQ
jgi:DNA-directed RNA polymerase subunit N (RpoN/RPB10)